MCGNKKGKSPLHINKQHYWRVPVCSCMCEKNGGMVVNNTFSREKRSLIIPVLVISIIIGMVAGYMWHKHDRQKTVMEKSVGTPVTNVVHVDGIDPVIKDLK